MKRLLISAAVMLAACGGIQNNIDDQSYPGELIWTNIGNVTEVVRVTIDGIDCVVASENNGGAVAISCDWSDQ